jgi:hypothetical protein
MWIRDMLGYRTFETEKPYLWPQYAQGDRRRHEVQKMPNLHELQTLLDELTRSSQRIVKTSYPGIHFDQSDTLFDEH